MAISERPFALDREGLIRLWERTYDGDAEAIEQARKLCDECVDAVLGAAGKPGTGPDGG